MLRSVLFVLGLSVFCGLGCQRAKQGAKDALNKGGEITGAAASEVLEGVTTGVEETWKVDVQLSATRVQQGLGLGKTTVESHSLGNNNLLIVYLTTTQAVKDTLRVRALDQEGLEMGRATLVMDAAAGSGAFYEVHFPERTDLERKSTVVVE
jgi:hypothetical protein